MHGQQEDIAQEPCRRTRAAAKPAGAPAAAPPAIAPPGVLNGAAAYAGVKIEPPAYDAVAAKGAAETLQPRLAVFPAEQLAVPRLDVRSAALAALGVHAFVTQVAGVRERFQAMAQIGEFHLANLEDLKTVAFLVIYAHGQAEAAGAFQTDVKVPPALVKEGSELEDRMQELCEYKFKRDAAIAPLLSMLSPGTGHRDLATDLLGYAEIYEARPAEAASDTTNYRATDVADARRIAGEILAHLSAAMSPKARDAYDLLQRAWTLLLQIYFEVQKVGLCLLRHDPRQDEWFPSLFAAGRSGRPRKKKDEGEGRAAGGRSNGDAAKPDAG